MGALIKITPTKLLLHIFFVMCSEVYSELLQKSVLQSASHLVSWQYLKSLLSFNISLHIDTIYMKLHVLLFGFLYHLPALLVLHAASNKSTADGLSKLWKFLMWLDRFIKCSQIVHSWIDISSSSASYIRQCVCICTRSRWEPWPHIKKLINLRALTNHHLVDHESVRPNYINKWP